MSAIPIQPGAAAALDLSVVLPVYSETDSLRDLVAFLTDKFGADLREIVIVRSPKASAASVEVCASLAARDPRVRVIVQSRNPGLGLAVRQGLAVTRGGVVLSMDSDGEMENATIERMARLMRTGQYDLVLASRWLKGGGFHGYSRLKLVLNWTFQQVFRLLFRTKMHDLTYGFKMMRGDWARGFAWKGELHEIACETTLRPIRARARVAEVPSRWTARTMGVSQNKFMRNFRYVGMAMQILLRPSPLMPIGAQ